MALWYYSDRDQQKGPVPFDELKQRAQAGYLRPSDLVWEEGTPDWVRASRVNGLFEEAAGPGDEPVPRRRPDHDRDFDRGRGRERPRPRDIARREQGMPTGVKVGLIVGGCVLFLGVVAVIIIVVVNSGGASGSQTFSMELFAGGSGSRNMNFRAGQTVEINVRTTPRGGFADVDLAVFDPRGIQVASDVGVGMDARVRFTAHVAGSYRIELRNLGPAAAGTHTTVRTF